MVAKVLAEYVLVSQTIIRINFYLQQVAVAQFVNKFTHTVVGTAGEEANSDVFGDGIDHMQIMDSPSSTADVRTSNRKCSISAATYAAITSGSFAWYVINDLTCPPTLIKTYPYRRFTQSNGFNVSSRLGRKKVSCKNKQVSVAEKLVVVINGYFTIIPCIKLHLHFRVNSLQIGSSGFCFISPQVTGVEILAGGITGSDTIEVHHCHCSEPRVYKCTC